MVVLVKNRYFTTCDKFRIMKRRKVVIQAGTIFSFAIAGCNNDQEENEGGRNQNKILIDPSQLDEDEVDDSTQMCELQNLSQSVQDDIKKAIAEDGYSTSDPDYGVGHECYGIPIRVENKFYRVLIAQP